MSHFANPFIKVAVKKTNGVTTVEVSGEVDLGTLPHLQRMLNEALEQDAHDIIVDLRSVSFIDSSGVGALIGAKKKLLASRGELHVVYGNEQMRRKLGIMKLGSILCLHETIEDALREIKEGSGAQQNP